ncbi:hypothetical protein HNQ80_000521 [Anaerosolibacter carboniphilus]|uniref:DUF4132 domain-containing protein n=1 Tax=Anaerosolibacter carboniphilus TaxID=1417629 RepID=A0A841KMG1_9FIRM|nr:DUF4132 domain-containing protein [Anaerosolibacter carboniphilus]MBB6214441.1 hypothetical protein [Anaerosolibacter carboniphilus]
MYINHEKREIMDSYLNKSFLQKLLFLGRGLDIANVVIDYIKADYNSESAMYNKLLDLLWSNGTKDIREVFTGKEYGALKLLLGDHFAEIFKHVWDRATLYTYTTGYCRRSYRTKVSSRLYLNKNINKLVQCIYLAATDFSLEQYLSYNKSNDQDVSMIADIISIEIDNNNQEVLNKIRDIIYSDNNSAIVTRQIIQGMLMSRNEEAHKMIGELLLAAKLQEGLRQVIVESMDECSREGFIYLLKLILDNNLSRFSSIVRAFGTWTGLAIDHEKPKMINKCLEAAYHCLMSKAYLDECIHSTDNLRIYIGIWATAFDEVEDIDSILGMLLQSTEKYKKLVALQFLYQTQFTIFKHQIASKVLWEKDFEVLALAIKNLFGDLTLYGIRNHAKESLDSYAKLDDYCYGIKLFDQLKTVIDTMPKKELDFKGSVFPWLDIKLTASEIMDKMIFAVALSYDEHIIDTLIDYRDKMSADTRHAFVDIFLKKPKTMKQKIALLEACGDRSPSVRESAYEIVNHLELSKDEYVLIENFLQYKSGDLRKNVIKLLLKQGGEALTACVNRLVNSKNENKRMGAIDIVSAMESDSKHKKAYRDCLNLITSMGDTTQKEKILTQNITSDTKGMRTYANGFGLYDPFKEVEIQPITRPKDFKIKSVFSISTHRLEDILNRFSDLIHVNRDLEYEVVGWDDAKTVITLGGSNFLTPFNRSNDGLDNYPLSDQIREIVKSQALDFHRLIEVDFYLGAIHRLNYETYAPWYHKLLEDRFNLKVLKASLETVEKLLYAHKVKAYIHLLVEEIPQIEKFKLAKAVLEDLYGDIPGDKHHTEYLGRTNRYYYYDGKDYIARSYEIKYWLTLMEKSHYDDESFTHYFTIAYNYYKACQYAANTTLTLAHFGRALELAIIDENEVYKELMARPLSPNNIQTVTSVQRHDRDNLRRFPHLMELGATVVENIANIEVTRGELNTEVTHLAAKIQKCFGTNIFIVILLGSEKDTYIRGYNFVTGDCTKKQMFSHLLKCCYPKDGEDANTLGILLKGKKVTNKQLIEAAMYAPQWLDIVAEYLGYKGLKAACWYFHAHVNDYFSEEKSTIVARYSPITPQEFRDGAFDRDWFMDAYYTIGEKNFKLVYDSAKYIAGGGLHKRSQLFADATLGKLDVQEVQFRIMDKRNKDYLLAFGLIPIKDKGDILSRYEYIQQYLKESKQFGTQRQASEARSAHIALLNLARNAGYSDVNRLVWNMETAKLDTIRIYLQPYKLEDIEIQLVIDKLGQANIQCTKDGKILKDIPAKHKKHEYVQAIKAVRKSLKDQYIRAKHSFEASMERGEDFETGELMNLCINPVLAPIIENLVFVSDKKLGYFHEGNLVDDRGKIHPLEPEDKIMIAHPVHLYESGEWSNYQKHLFAKKIIQPFKQVFREMYLPNTDELKEQTISRRYAGHQIQPKKAVALLKTRGWLASYEEGLQKVYYKEDIIATIYALADWFSPSDIEAPTIEVVRFEDRKTFKPVPIDKVSKLIFSEVMRDVDLVVSVAHVGGVDPEASLSTMEIRSAIVEELMKLLKLTNVTIKGSHAHILGVHGEYTVHLGSGTVHKMGTGSINILPVHSSHRGRIFLPFIDEDPKSAEILSKIILLAEDSKLKDPSILVQITS